MDFKLKIFVYLDDSLPTPEAILLVRQVFSQCPVSAGIAPDISPDLVASPVCHIHVSR